METMDTRDWAHLHPELLEMIGVRLTEIVDRVGFSSVCPQWRSASKSIAHNLPPQLPWLLLPEESKDTGNGTTARRFFSLSHNRIFDITLPEYRGTRTIRAFPSSFGRILKGIETIELLNRLTLSSGALPPLPLKKLMRRHGGALRIRTVKIFASNVVAVVFPHGRDILFCRPGDSSWKRLYLASCYPMTDFVYYKGRFFVMNPLAEIVWVFDADTLQKISEIRIVVGIDSLGEYLVESFTGDLLLVLRTACDEGKPFELFQLDESEEQVKWMKISSIGDNALFVDGLRAMAFEATGSNCWRGNCIYFVDFLPLANHGLTVFHDGEGEILRAALEHGLIVFNVGEGRIEELPLFSCASSEHGDEAMWVVPTLF